MNQHVWFTVITILPDLKKPVFINVCRCITLIEYDHLHPDKHDLSDIQQRRQTSHCVHPGR